MKRITNMLLALLLILGGWMVFESPTAWASCEVQSGSVTYENGDFIGGDLCDTTGAKKVTTTGGAITTLGTNEAAAPTRVEQSAGSFSFDLSGNARITPGTLLFGEDYTNEALKVEGANVRGSVGNVASGLLIAADCTLHCTPAVVVALPIGSKTFTSTIVSATSGDTIVKQTHKIYGANISTFTDDDAVLLCTITFTATTQYLTKKFTKSCDPVTANFLFYGAIASGTGSGAGVVTGAVDATY